jgi:2-polyprenyl-3-methyl-5-hydroxy-6-metoxy-1,4-benzoquinol methylase
MTNGISERFLSFSRFVFFDILSDKFNSAPFKNLMDYAYVIFEKIAYSFEIMSSNYLKLYDELIEKEIKMAHITDKSNILVIGCGALPVTPILIASKTNAGIVGIDYDLKAVKKAKSYIKKNFQSPKLNIEHADGLKYPFERFDVIFVLYGVKNQLQILKNISKNMKNQGLVVFRTTQDVLDKKYKGTTLLSDMFNIKDSLASDSIYTSYSYLLSKK